MNRLIITVVILLWSIATPGHHWVRDIYDEEKRVIVEVEVKKFALVNPHPFLFVEITGIPEGQVSNGLEIGQTWTLEMDNLRELVELGINKETFIPGDQVLVAVDPSRNELYRKNTLYLRAVEHQREGFVYVHNVRQLFPIDSGEENLSKHLPKAR